MTARRMQGSYDPEPIGWKCRQEEALSRWDYLEKKLMELINRLRLKGPNVPTDGTRSLKNVFSATCI